MSEYDFIFGWQGTKVQLDKILGSTQPNNSTKSCPCDGNQCFSSTKSAKIANLIDGLLLELDIFTSSKDDIAIRKCAEKIAKLS